MIRIVIALAFIITMFACQTSNSIIEYDVLRPAKYSIPPEIKSVVLVNNSLPYLEKNIHVAVVDDFIQPLDSVWYEGYADSVIHSLYRNLQSRNFFDTVYIDTLYRKKATSGMLNKISDWDMQGIYNRFDADAILSIDAYTYGTKVKVESYPESYYSTMAMYGISYWRFHDRFQQDPIFEDVQNDSIYWHGSGDMVETSVMRFPSILEGLKDFSYYIGENFVDEIVPKWEGVERDLFLTGHPYFISAAEWLSKNNNDEAKKLWGYIFEHGKPIDKARAAHNIAIILEKEDDIYNAMKWAYNSYDAYKLSSGALYKTELNDSKRYYIYLSQRKQELEKLQIQMGGGNE